MKITITPTEKGFSVRQGDLEIGCWKTAPEAKAARGALDKALREGVNPALAVFCGIQAANDSVVVGSYNDTRLEASALNPVSVGAALLLPCGRHAGLGKLWRTARSDLLR